MRTLISLAQHLPALPECIPNAPPSNRTTAAGSYNMYLNTDMELLNYGPSCLYLKTDVDMISAHTCSAVILARHMPDPFNT